MWKRKGKAAVNLLAPGLMLLALNKMSGVFSAATVSKEEVATALLLWTIGLGVFLWNLFKA